jgi:hypothetical protein
MSNYLQIYQAADNTDFQARCRVATWMAAQDIASEAEDTPNHAMRADWAKRVLQETIGICDRQLAVQVLRNQVIATDPANAADSDIQFQVNSVLDAIMAIG